MWDKSAGHLCLQHAVLFAICFGMKNVWVDSDGMELQIAVLFFLQLHSHCI
jgi:hypothetical protein